MKLPLSPISLKPDAAFPDRTEIHRPIVALYLVHGDHQVVAFAIVDSGADNCVFPASVASDLGIALPNSRASSFSGSTNQSQLAFYEQIQATILPMEGPNIAPDQEPISFSLYAGFCETLEHVGLGLLGQEGFFSQFTVSFHAPDQYFEVLARPEGTNASPRLR